MRLHELRPAKGARKAGKRVGRGIGSGRGKTAGRGHKGQLARSGGGKGAGFEGGQTPLQIQLPKRGFSNAPFARRMATVNVEDLNRFDEGTVVTPELLMDNRMVRKTKDGIKVLGGGELTRALTVRANAFSQGAAAKIEAAGGKIEVV